MPLTVLPPNSFDMHGQRVILGGVLDDGATTFDAALDGFSDECSQGHSYLKAASLNVSCSSPPVLHRIDMTTIVAADDEDTIAEGASHTLDEDHSSLMGTTPTQKPIILHAGDLRVVMWWDQHGGHNSAGAGEAFLCQHVDNNIPPNVKVMSYESKGKDWHQDYYSRETKSLMAGHF